MAELQQQLQEVGVLLINPCSSSLDKLVTLLDRVEKLLMRVEQRPSGSMKDAVISVMKGLISTALLRNSNPDVRVSLAFCYTQFTRITAPDAPYDDHGMKKLYQLTIEAFQYLSNSSSRYYSKAVSILSTFALINSCLVMPDLKLDQLILELFQHFLAIDRSNCSPDTILAMETVMSMVIDETEDVSVAMLTPLLASVRKDNQTISPIAWQLGEKVMTNCAAKLKTSPLNEAVHSIGIALDDYASIVADICQDSEHQPLPDSRNRSKPTVPRKRGRKRKSLRKIEEVYDHPTVQTETGRRRGTPRKNGTKDSDISAAPVTDKVLSSQLKASNADNLAKLIVGKRIRVWWPEDKEFYEGAVHSYDPTSKKHKILYADGDVEILNLEKERWELSNVDELQEELGSMKYSCTIESKENVPSSVGGSCREETAA